MIVLGCWKKINSLIILLEVLYTYISIKKCENYHSWSIHPQLISFTVETSRLSVTMCMVENNMKQMTVCLLSCEPLWPRAVLLTYMVYGEQGVSVHHHLVNTDYQLVHHGSWLDHQVCHFSCFLSAYLFIFSPDLRTNSYLSLFFHRFFFFNYSIYCGGSILLKNTPGPLCVGRGRSFSGRSYSSHAPPVSSVRVKTGFYFQYSPTDGHTSQ